MSTRSKQAHKGNKMFEAITEEFTSRGMNKQEAQDMVFNIDESLNDGLIYEIPVLS